MKDLAKEFLELVFSSKKVFVLTGAGISTPSGIPDFRGKGGLYEKVSPDIFDIQKFYENPENFYSHAKEMIGFIKKAKPNPAHKMLAEIEKRGINITIATQNIDGLHQKAGSKKVLELHGSFNKAFCTRCGREYKREKIFKALENDSLPMCKCGGVLKPDIVFFGEPLPEEALMEAINSASSSDLSIVIGSSLVVYPAASLPQYSINSGAKLLIVNMGETPYDSYSWRKYEVSVDKFGEEVIKLLKTIKPQ